MQIFENHENECTPILGKNKSECVWRSRKSAHKKVLKIDWRLRKIVHWDRELLHKKYWEWMHMEIEKDCTSRRLFLSPFVNARPQGSPHPQKHLIHNRLIGSNTQLTIIDKYTIYKWTSIDKTSTIYKSPHPNTTNITWITSNKLNIQHSSYHMQ